MGSDFEGAAVLSDIQDILITSKTNDSWVLDSLCQKLFAGLSIGAVWGGIIDHNQRLSISGITEESAGLNKNISVDGLHIPSIRQCIQSLLPVRLTAENNDLPAHLFHSCPSWFQELHTDIHPLIVENTCIGVLAISAANTLINQYHGILKLCVKHANFVFSTLRMLANQEDSQSELKMAAAVFDNSLEGIFITDGFGAILSVNEAVTQITGFSRSELLGQNPRILKSGRHGQDFYETLWAGVKKYGQWKGEIWNKRKNGEVFPEWLSISAIRNEDGRVEKYIGIFIDISKQKAAENQLHYLAYYDKLSDLPNRELFHDRLNLAIARAKRNKTEIAVLFIDIDHFKYINDTFGHDKGDLLLRKVAATLKSCIRENDTLARLGGDEFTIIIEDFNQHDDVEITARRILDSFKNPLSLNNQDLYISVSIGVSFFPKDANSRATLIKHADTAMYSAKNNGRKCLQYFHKTMESYSIKRIELEKQLRQALENQEFQLFFQPQINIKTGRLVGAEALIRWLHPEKGLLSPKDFISIAEDTGMIIPIGEWVLKQAWTECQRWHAAGWQIRVGVNLSSLQFDQSSIGQLLSEVIESADLDAGFLDVELTETLAMRQVNDTLEAMGTLKNLGIQLSIDDFGTGYSSLGYLKRFPIDHLKIDRCFVGDITSDPNDAAIVIAIIAMAHCMGLTVIAEGVETAEQLAFLTQHGCDEIQGYLIGKPMPGDSFIAFLQGDYGGSNGMELLFDKEKI